MFFIPFRFILLGFVSNRFSFAFKIFVLTYSKRNNSNKPSKVGFLLFRFANFRIEVIEGVP